MLCVIIPTLNAQDSLPATLDCLVGHCDDIIISDGLSQDQTLRLGVENGARLALGCPGRGWQLARAAQFSDSDWLLFLHADTRLSANWVQIARAHMNTNPGKAGYFRLRFDARGWRPRVAEFLVRLRCAWFALPYGDQGLLISKSLYEQVGGYPKIDLFEDVAIVRALGRRRLKGLQADAMTDASTYERMGYVRRGARNVRLLRRYIKGEDIASLKREYLG